VFRRLTRFRYSPNIAEMFAMIRDRPLRFPAHVEVSRHARDLLCRLLEKAPSVSFYLSLSLSLSLSILINYGRHK
jgi:hypothetical protein